MPSRSYDVRKGRKGWSVYASQTGKPVRLNGHPQIGLSLETAAQLAAVLEVMDFLHAENASWMITDRPTIH
ncbi:conserved hypothetical protein (plasmid) [Methylobacterium nodulans ORS 2060]|uniref:Uncharacterized protein n=1 Tax=Methylobacterium nodulans (strain LMG 21967 / CNCM I-2342 / ORS 2060) TaxID=460265 RepID=B8IVT1_METNO|nr:hypothetical protein [Methylobacterium nodulans]ACL62521.1 conserved hypothetical protein [Methylobacterium nodulans ORS 2060]